MSTLFTHLTNMFQKTLDNTSFKDDNICNNYQEYLASCLTGFLTTGMADKNTTALLFL